MRADLERAAGLAPEERDAREAYAESCCARWGCGAEHEGEPPADFVDEAEAVRRLMGAEPAPGCPLHAVHHPSEWLVEITLAVALAVDWHVPLEATLGRDLTVADVAALGALRGAQMAAMASDNEIREREREENERRNRGPQS